MLFWFYYDVLKIKDHSPIFEELPVLCGRWHGETPGSYSNSSLEAPPPLFLSCFELKATLKPIGLSVASIFKTEEARTLIHHWRT